MEILFYANGCREDVGPKYGPKFTLFELQNYVDGPIELVPSCLKGVHLVVNEEGKLNHMEYNKRASELMLNDLDYIVGDAVLVEDFLLD